MNPKFHSVVFAHMSGFGDLHCHPNSHHVYSCGSDNAIRIFDTDSKLLTSLEGHHTAAVRSLAFSPDGYGLATGGDDHSIHTFTILNTDAIRQSMADSSTPSIPKVKFDATVHRLPGTVHAVAYHPGGNMMAVGGDDKNIKLINLLDISQVNQLVGHPTSVRYLSFSPQGDLLSSIDSLGTLHINSWSDKKNLFMENICQRIDVNKTQQMAKCSWSHDSKLLAIPGRTDIRLLTAESTFKQSLASLSGGHTEPVSICAFSPNSLYLASYAADRKIVIWEIKTGEVLTATVVDDDADTNTHCMAISWCINENAVFLLDDQGYIKKWANLIPSRLPSAYKKDDAIASSLGTSSKDAIDTTELDPVGDTIDDEDEELAHNNVSRSSRTSGDGDGSDDTDTQHRKRLRKAGDAKPPSSSAALNEGLPDDFDDDDDMEDFIVDDTNGGYKDNDDDYLSRKHRESLTHNPHTQAAFQPSSTAYDPVSKRRYLCWNLIGNIVTQNSDVFHSIEIAFSDTSKHKAIRLRDHYGFTMGSLGDHGCVLASPYENTQRPSVVFFRAFDSWAAQSDWTMHLPSPENITAVAIGNKFVAIATDKQWVRINSFSGIQLTVLCVKGPVVSIIGHQHLLAIVYHSAMPLPQHQNQNVVILDVERKRQLCEAPLCLSPGATLVWLHFSDHGMLLTMDSVGVVRALSRQWDNSWIAVLDTANMKKANKNEVYWPVGLLGQDLMCAVCRSGIKVPSTITKPVLTPIVLNIPFVTTDYSTAEEAHARNDLLLFEQYSYQHSLSVNHHLPFIYNPTPKEQANLDSFLLPSIQLACKSDQSSKALDLCSSLMLVKSLELMMKLANHERKINLAGRIGLLMGAKEREKEREKERLLLGKETEGKMSIDAFLEQGEKRIAEEKRRRLEKLRQEEQELYNQTSGSGYTATNKSNKRIAAERQKYKGMDEQLDAESGVDEGESELVYNKHGKKRAKIVEKSEEHHSSTAAPVATTDLSSSISAGPVGPVIVEDDGVAASLTEGGKNINFLAEFKKQKDAEKAAAAKEKENTAKENETHATKKEKSAKKKVEKTKGKAKTDLNSTPTKTTPVESTSPSTSLPVAALNPFSLFANNATPATENKAENNIPTRSLNPFAKKS